MLTLMDAIRHDKLEEFIRQEEARGVVGDRDAFDRLIKAAVKPPRSEDRTSRSASSGGSSGT